MPSEELVHQTSSADMGRELSLLRSAVAHLDEPEKLTRYQERSGACLLSFHAIWNVCKLLLLGVLLLVSGIDNSQDLEEFYDVPENCAQCYDIALGTYVPGEEDPAHVFELAKCQRTFDSWKVSSSSAHGVAAVFNCTTNMLCEGGDDTILSDAVALTKHSAHARYKGYTYAAFAVTVLASCFIMYLYLRGWCCHAAGDNPYSQQTIFMSNYRIAFFGCTFAMYVTTFYTETLHLMDMTSLGASSGSAGCYVAGKGYFTEQAVGLYLMYSVVLCICYNGCWRSREDPTTLQEHYRGLCCQHCSDLTLVAYTFLGLYIGFDHYQATKAILSPLFAVATLVTLVEPCLLMGLSVSCRILLDSEYEMDNYEDEDEGSLQADAALADISRMQSSESQTSTASSSRRPRGRTAYELEMMERGLTLPED